MPPTHSKAALILEQPAVQPGSQANLGIQFVTEKGWHIYWQNPGDSGEPPRIQWRLPAGFTAGPQEWPAPMRLSNPAGTDYGYEGTTILLSTLQIPPTAQSGSTMELGGELRWLVCHDICVPQRTQLKAPIRIASAISIDHTARQLLQAAAERVPKPFPASFHARVTSSPDVFNLTFSSKERIVQAEFFPSEAEQIDNEAPQRLTEHGQVTRLTLKKSDHLRQDPEHLRGVLILEGRNAYQIDVPIHSSSLRKERQ
jgi:thiol:disulfide interchange protein DsbD